MIAEQPDCTYDPWQPKKLLDAPVPPRIFRLSHDLPWAFNPWTGGQRHSSDVQSDPQGRAIWLSAWGPLRAVQPVQMIERADGVIDKAVQYNAGSIECVDAIEAALTPEEFRGFLKGNVIKYAWRERHKGGAESMKKAQWYLAKWIAVVALAASVVGCGSDYASPFDKPDETVQPVTCAASTPCAQ